MQAGDAPPARAFGQRGSGAGELQNPYAVAVDWAGNPTSRTGATTASWSSPRRGGRCGPLGGRAAARASCRARTALRWTGRATSSSRTTAVILTKTEPVSLSDPPRFLPAHIRTPAAIR
jgi:hypothetical protein